MTFKFQIISSSIASGTEIDGLRGLVTQEALREVKDSVAKMSMAQRNQLAVDKDDVYFCFPYQIGIMFDESDSVQKRWVEITMVYHVLRGEKCLFIFDTLILHQKRFRCQRVRRTSRTDSTELWHGSTTSGKVLNMQL